MIAKLAVLVVNWNGWKDTLAAHASLEASEEQDWHLYIVDNASSDGSVDKLRGLSKTTLIENTRNDGFAGACNIGIRKAIEDQCEFVFLLNNDATVQRDTLGSLLRYAEGQDRAVFGCAIRIVGTDEWQFFGSRTGPDGAPSWLKHPRDEEAFLQPLIPSDFIHGAALFARTRHFAEIGLFDERFFLTYEETDWCYRATARGFSNLVVRDAVVHHQTSKALGNLESPLQSYFLCRNRLLFLEKHAGLRKLIQGLREARWAARGAPTASTRAAMNMAIRHYLLRRFGDCPQSIRSAPAVA